MPSQAEGGSAALPADPIPSSFLPGVHTLLRKLQFLFELPARLTKCVELEAYGQAVRYYSKARSILHQYQHMPSFRGIQDDCQKIMADLAQKLREKFRWGLERETLLQSLTEWRSQKGLEGAWPAWCLEGGMTETCTPHTFSFLCRDGGSSAKDLAECVELLLQLGEPAEELCDEFLSHACCRLEAELRALEAELGEGPPLSTASPPTDILEFIDRGCNSFVSNMCLVIASYQELFISREGAHGIAGMAQDKLVAFVDGLMGRYFALVERRIQLEKGVGDNSLLVWALDRFHRRLQALVKLLPASKVAAEGTEIVVRAAKERIRQYLQALQSFYVDCLTDVRQSLAAPRLMGKDSPNLAELLGTISASILNQIKSVLTYVHLFTAKDITFSNKPYFKVGRETLLPFSVYGRGREFTCRVSACFFFGGGRPNPMHWWGEACMEWPKGRSWDERALLLCLEPSSPAFTPNASSLSLPCFLPPPRASSAARGSARASSSASSSRSARRRSSSARARATRGGPRPPRSCCSSLASAWTTRRPPSATSSR